MQRDQFTRDTITHLIFRDGREITLQLDRVAKEAGYGRLLGVDGQPLQAPTAHRVFALAEVVSAEVIPAEVVPAEVIGAGTGE